MGLGGTDAASLKLSTIKKYGGEQFTQDDISMAYVVPGYTLAGWYFDTAYTKPFEAFTVKKSLTLYAKYTKAGQDVKSYTITYAAVHSAVSPKTTTGTITQAELPTLSPFDDTTNFWGWYYDPAYTNPVQVGDTISKDTTFYAKWSTDLPDGTYKITYVNDKATAPMYQSLAKDSLVTNALLLSELGVTRGIEGYVFGGWFYDSNFTQRVLLGDAVTEDKTFYAKWISLSEIKEKAGATQNFVGIPYSDITGTLYTRSAESNAIVGSYVYSPITEFASSSTVTQKCFLGADAYYIDKGAVIWQENFISTYLNVNKNETVTSRLDFQPCTTSDNFIEADDTEVDLSSLRGFLAIKPTADGSLYVTFTGANTSKITGTSKSVAALVNESGKILSAKQVDNKTDTTYVLSAEVKGGELIFLVWSRNGDAGGAIKVLEISDEEPEIKESDLYKVTYVNVSPTADTTVTKTTDTGLVTNSLYYSGSGVTRGIEGYFFGGWYYDSEFTKQVLPGDTLESKETTFYAKWLTMQDISDMAESSQNFVGVSFSEIDGVLCTRSTDKNTVTDTYDYTLAQGFTTLGVNYYLGAGLSKFADGAVVWQERIQQGLTVRVNGYSAVTARLSNPKTNDDKILVTDTSFDLKNCRIFVAVKATGEGTVTARGYFSSAAETAVIALVNEKGEILKAQTVGEKTYAEISADVAEPGLIFFLFSRNDDTSGSFDLYDMAFKKPGALTLPIKTKTVSDASLAPDIIKNLTSNAILDISGALNAARLKEIVSAMKYNDSVKVALDLSATSGITEIKASEDLFKGCETLLGISLPKTVTSIEANAFEGCTALEEVILPENLHEIPDYAFYGCTSLSTINFPDSLWSIGKYAFGGLVEFDEDGNMINWSSGCPLTTVDLSKTQVKYLSEGVFFECSLNSVTLPDSLYSIGEWAFNSCYSLTSVTIPASVISIEYGAFSSCDSLTSVAFEDTEKWSNVTDNKSSIVDVSDAETNAEKLRNYEYNCLVKGD
ncbi:MAG: leucine-rich repeat protein [Treponema sp.]|nr:leucine-rich repeat protein [Treponema sp.]